MPQAHSPTAVHPHNELSGPVGVDDVTHMIPRLCEGFLDSSSLAAVGGGAVSGLHVLTGVDPGYVPVAVGPVDCLSDPSRPGVAS